MPTVQMPDGTYVEIAEGTSPEVLKRIASNYMPKGGKSAPSILDQEAGKREKFISGLAGAAGSGNASTEGWLNRFVHSATLGADDKLSSLAAAGMSYLGGAGEDDKYLQDKSFGERFGLYSDVHKRMRSEEETKAPGLTASADLPGMFATPVGAETGLGRLAARIAPALKSRVAASGAGRLAAKLGESSVGIGARTGANYGALKGAIDTVDDPSNMAGNAANEALIGGVGGAAFGGVAGLGGKVLHVIADRKAENASNVAYRKIAAALERSHNPNKPGNLPYDATSAVNEIKATDRGGGDAMLMDLSPEMRNMGGYLASRPGLRAANKLEERVANRTEAAPDRFDAGVNKAMGVKPGQSTDAYEFSQKVNEARKAAGQADYAIGGLMDKRINHSPDMDEFLREAPPATEAALRSAYLDMLNRREMPAHLNKGPDGSFTHIPNMRTYDYTKRAFDNEIGMALKAGDRSRAQALSQELTTFKGLLIDANPQYADILSRQRDAFQQIQSIELGTNFLKRMRSDSRSLLSEMQKDTTNQNALKLGVADALLHMRTTSDNPVALMRRMMRHEDQRKVLRYVFGSNKTLAEFEKFMRRELRTSNVDRIVNPTTGSKTNVLNQQGEADSGQSVALVGRDALQGFAFGGPAGAGSRVLRRLDTLSSGLGPHAQERLAEILMGKGKGLREGVDSSSRYLERREAASKRRATLAGKTAGGLLTGYSKE